MEEVRMLLAIANIVVFGLGFCSSQYFSAVSNTNFLSFSF